MTPLRQRFIEDMQLRGLSSRTQQAYVQAVRQLVVYYAIGPDQLSEQELRHYFLYLRNVKRASRSTATVTLCALKFLESRPSSAPGRSWSLSARPKPTLCWSS
jgi:integrase/recombinase XerD